MKAEVIAKRIVYAGLVIYLCLTVIQIYLIATKFVFTGRATGQVGLSVLEPCSVYLEPGWNLFSICSNVSNSSVEAILFGIDYRYVMVWNASNQSFVIYSPRAASNPFDVFDSNWSYFILSNQVGWLQIAGPEWSDVSIDLFYGWNSPAWPYRFDTNVLSYLNSIAGKYRYVMLWNASTQAFEVWSPLSASPAPNITKGQGQFIAITEPIVILVYNKSALQP